MYNITGEIKVPETKVIPGADREMTDVLADAGKVCLESLFDYETDLELFFLETRSTPAPRDAYWRLARAQASCRRPAEECKFQYSLPTSLYLTNCLDRCDHFDSTPWDTIQPQPRRRFESALVCGPAHIGRAQDTYELLHWNMILGTVLSLAPHTTHNPSVAPSRPVMCSSRLLQAGIRQDHLPSFRCPKGRFAQLSRLL